MGGNFRPLSCANAQRALRNLGFNEMPAKGTSHRQWTKINQGKFYKVTLDCHRGEVKPINIRSMAKQAGVGIIEFYEAAKK